MVKSIEPYSAAVAVWAVDIPESRALCSSAASIQTMGSTSSSFSNVLILAVDANDTRLLAIDALRIAAVFEVLAVLLAGDDDDDDKEEYIYN
jgi:hypothetical protein